MKTIGYIVFLFCAFCSATAQAMPSWMVLEKGCKFNDDLIKRFEYTIQPARAFILENTSKPNTIRNVKIEFSCSPNSLGVASYIKNSEERIIIGAGFLDTAERLSDVYYIMLINGVDHNEYIEYLVKNIVAKTAYDDIMMPADYYNISSSKLAQFNSGTGRATRSGIFGGMLIFALGHEYGHIRYKHLVEGIRVKTNYPRNSYEGYLFRKQEYAADFYASYVLQKGELPVFVGVLLNEFMIEADKLGATYSVLNTHPPTYARSIYLIGDQISEISDQPNLSKKEKVNQISTLKRMKHELKFEMYDELGEYKLREHIASADFDSCMGELDLGCVKACKNVYGISASKCTELCSTQKQHKSNVVSCHLRLVK